MHGDFRLGNWLVEQRGDGATLLGVLDWEMVHLGDPLEDLAWCSCELWRGGNALGRRHARAGGLPRRVCPGLGPRRRRGADGLLPRALGGEDDRDHADGDPRLPRRAHLRPADGDLRPPAAVSVRPARARARLAHGRSDVADSAGTPDRRLPADPARGGAARGGLARGARARLGGARRAPQPARPHRGEARARGDRGATRPRRRSLRLAAALRAGSDPEGAAGIAARARGGAGGAPGGSRRRRCARRWPPRSRRGPRGSRRRERDALRAHLAAQAVRDLALLKPSLLAEISKG